MPIPKPKPGEDKQKFVGRCMGDATMNKDYPDQKQRAAICYGQVKNNMETYSQPVPNYTVEKVTHQGRQFLVVPVNMMTEGVHKGSHGAVFHSIDELGKFPASWNGIPVTIQHPKDPQGNPISANSPDVIDGTTVGRVYHTNVDGDVLKSKAYLDEQRLRQVSPLAAEYIDKGLPLEVSLGMFTEDEPNQGVWRNEQYSAVATNHRPDHLALLPGGRGACSWADGCGIRANEESGEVVFVANSLMNNINYTKIMDALRQKIDDLDTKDQYHSLLEATDSYLIYRRSDGKFFKQDYSIDANNNVTFDGMAQPMNQKISYVNANAKGDNRMADNKNDKKPCCPEKVELLIQDENSKFTEDDREFLLTLSAEQLEKVQPVTVEVEKIVEVEKKVQINDDEMTIKVKEVLANSFADQANFISLLPKEIKDQVESGLKLHSEMRAGMIQSILTNQSSDVFAKEELEALPAAQLQKLADAMRPKQYRMGAGGGGVNTNEEKLLPPGIA